MNNNKLGSPTTSSRNISIQVIASLKQVKCVAKYAVVSPNCSEHEVSLSHKSLCVAHVFMQSSGVAVVVVVLVVVVAVEVVVVVADAVVVVVVVAVVVVVVVVVVTGTVVVVVVAQES